MSVQRFASFIVLLFLCAVMMGGCMEGGASDAATLVDEEGNVDWSRYYNSAKVHQIMEAFAERHPNLTNLYSIGQSYEGRELMVMEITNQDTGPPEEKPGFYIDGSVHGQELTGSAVALYFLVYLLEHYGEDPEVTELVDTRTFYIRPLFNPDGVDLVLAEDQWVRSSVRPVDDDRDGIPDNDPPEDLNGDGRILHMRVEDREGEYVEDPNDPRIMVSREEEDEGPFYRLIREGVDRNGDGDINSDPIGGIDMNRNFPRNWERWHLQPGAGDFPLSEPETRATADFINAHRNINFIICGHTAGMNGGFIYRLPSAMDPREFDENDEELVVELGEYYTEYTGREVVPSATDPEEHRFGTLIQWGYSDYGAIGYVPEFSPPPSEWVPDYDNDGEVTEADWHRFNNEKFDDFYFSDWEPYEHPQLGEVEIGGWWERFWGQNPPHALLENELEEQVPWLMYLAAQTPMIEISEPVIEPEGEDRYVVEVTVRNTGYLATHVTERGHVGRETDDGLEWQVVPPPLVVLDIEGGRIAEGHHRKRIPHLAGSNPHTRSVTDQAHTAQFLVEATDPEVTVEITVRTEKAGTARIGPLRLHDESMPADTE